MASNESPNQPNAGMTPEEPSRNPLNLNFLRNFGDRKLTRDGQPAKKRGPKPDSKPALTRRQELNRQAQRTHRERKEAYIKALEQEVLRLKENFASVARTKDSLAEENRQLKQLLLQHGIAWNGLGGVDDFVRNAPVGDYPSSSSMSGSYATSSQTHSPTPPSIAYSMSSNVQSPPPQPAINYDQAGIDFVLTLERPCMDHLQFLVEKSLEPDGVPFGHAMMGSCPPNPFDPEGATYLNAAGELDVKAWDVSTPDLASLMDLSKRLHLDGEITPVMAWGMVLGHPCFPEFTLDDFECIRNDLVSKVRCYGFGAVLEEFEVRDAIECALYAKQDASWGR